jgi:hypothetical protein
VIAVTGGDPARATRLGAIELERRVRATAPGRHIGHTKIKQLIEKTSHPVGYRAARVAYAARLQRLMRRRALVEGQLEALEDELLHLYPRLPGAQCLLSLPGLRELDRALLLAAAGDIRRLRSPRALGKLGGCAPIARDSGNSAPQRKISERCRYQLLAPATSAPAHAEDRTRPLATKAASAPNQATACHLTAHKHTPPSTQPATPHNRANNTGRTPLPTQNMTNAKGQLRSRHPHHASASAHRSSIAYSQQRGAPERRASADTQRQSKPRRSSSERDG